MDTEEDGLMDRIVNVENMEIVKATRGTGGSLFSAWMSWQIRQCHKPQPIIGEYHYLSHDDFLRILAELERKMG